MDLGKLVRPVSRRSVFAMDGWYVWCGTMLRDNDGLCHLLFSRWPKETGFRGWVTNSEVGHATALQPLGPYRFQGSR